MFWRGGVPIGTDTWLWNQHTYKTLSEVVCLPVKWIPLVEINLLVLKQDIRAPKSYCLKNLDLIHHQISITKMYRKTCEIPHYYYFIDAPWIKQADDIPLFQFYLWYENMKHYPSTMARSCRCQTTAYYQTWRAP